MAISFLYLLISEILLYSTYALSSPYGETTRNVATQVLQGAGEASVDLNQYNLELDQIEKEWTAMFVQKATEQKRLVYLGAKSENEIFPDLVSVEFARNQNFGLGLELREIAGGRNDGLGITIVTGLTPGGPAEGSGIIPGDSIVKVSLIRRNRQISKKATRGLAEKEQELTVGTECLSYDGTVEAIVSLPKCNDMYEDCFRINLKRLRRRPKVSVTLQYPPEQNEPDTTIEMHAGENLRQGMLVRGVKLNDPLAKRFDTKSGGNCGAGGLCRTCSVSVLKGGDLLNPQRVAEKQMLEDTPRWRLACKAIVGFGMKEGEMTIRVNPRQW